MKYIKNFEDIKKFKTKFKINTPVKIIGNEDNIIWIIDGYDYDKATYIKNICRLKRYTDKDKLANHEGFYIWMKESDLIKAKQYEIDTNKYNL